MSDTLVIQSHRAPLPLPWLEPCLESVRAWAAARDFDYRFVGDELFDPVDPAIRAKTRDRIVIAADLARLHWLERTLAEGYACAIWCDADFLIFAPADFEPPATPYALGREVWVQVDAGGRLKVHRKVHNAFLMFRRGNAFLDFYADSAKRLIALNRGRMPPQFVGPKLLTALHNVVQCPVMERAGMLGPRVLEDILAGGGPALELMLERSEVAPAGANLSASLASTSGLDDGRMRAIIDRLLTHGLYTPWSSPGARNLPGHRSRAG